MRKRLIMRVLAALFAISLFISTGAARSASQSSGSNTAPSATSTAKTASTSKANLLDINSATMGSSTRCRELAKPMRRGSWMGVLIK